MEHSWHTHLLCCSYRGNHGSEKAERPCVVFYLFTFFFFYKALSVTFSKWLQDCVFLLLLMGFLRTGVWKNTEGSQTTKWTLMLTHIRSFGDGVLCSDFSLSNDGRGFFFPLLHLLVVKDFFISRHFPFCSGAERSRYLYSKWPFVKRSGEAITA